MLSDNNINYIDKRSESDIVWMPVTSNTKNDAEIVISKTSYKYEFKHRGAIATDSRLPFNWVLFITTGRREV